MVLKNLKLVFFFFFLIGTINHHLAQTNDELFTYSKSASLPYELGLNGAFVGVHNDVLIFAGGANFPNEAVWDGGKKVWHDHIYVFKKNENGEKQWKVVSTKLPRPLAYGAAIQTSEGLICFGGNNSKGFYSDVFILKWDPVSENISIEELPPMPMPLASMGAAILNDVVYFVGGQTDSDGPSTNTFLSFQLKSTITAKKFTWKSLNDFPGIHRNQAVVVSQSNGHQDCLYVFSGISYHPDRETTHTMLDDVYQFDPYKNEWFQKSDIPNNSTPGIDGGYLAAAPALALGDSHIVIFGGAGGSQQYLNQRLDIGKQLERLNASSIIDSLKISALRNKSTQLLKNTSFSKTIWAYHTITDKWVKKGLFSSPTQVVTTAVKWDGAIYIPGGEISPGVRTNSVIKLEQKPYEANFGLVNYITLITYLTLMILMGWYFSRRNKTTDDYFLGGKRIPWWAAGLSIYATMLSAITYLSQPALAYSFDWQAYLGYFPILLIVPVIITFYLPFFRKLNVTTAYEYLEKRFNVSVRMFGSTSFVLFQLVRMGIVVYLPALALATVVGMDIYLAIIVMGILAVVYTYMGGIEAVIWTDVIQVIVLILGLIAGLIFIGIDIGDIGYIFDTALTDGKMKMLDLRFSWTEVVTWSMFIGSFALNFAPYTTDQAVVQRYMTTKDEKAARKSIWLNGIIAIPSGLLIFLMGTFLYVYFKEHPEFLNIGMQNDSVFPLFITNHLPPGIAGLVIAGIYSASMSSLDSSMHSVSTVATVDYYKRFYKSYTEEKGLKLAKFITVFVGVIGTAIACLMAAFPVKSLFFFFQEVIGLFGSAIAGIFMLGIFIKKSNWKGTLIGAVLSILVLAFIKYNTPLNFYIYPLIAIPTCVISGWLFSLVFKVEQGPLKELVYQKSKS